MKNSMQTTISAIKKLPLAVSFNQVENWVQTYHFKERKKTIIDFTTLKNWVHDFSKN